MIRRATMVLVAIALAGCASRGERVEAADEIERGQYVDGRMLLPNASAGAAAIPTYEMRPQERFRMPHALEDALPQLPSGSPRQALPPTTVCVRAVVSAQGQVQRVDALDDRVECHAGNAVENADLLQAARDGVQRWIFAPAAICTWSAGAPMPKDADDCTGAAKVEPVPVSLLYAFTFEIREGKAIVRKNRVAQP